jgi:pyruvate dehydrogenase E1 component alpha subunit
MTYRYFGHSKSDRNLYRTKEEIQAWKEKDPIGRFETLLIDADVITDADVDEIYEEMNRSIDDAVAFAENSPEPDPSEVIEFVYA